MSIGERTPGEWYVHGRNICVDGTHGRIQIAKVCPVTESSSQRLPADENAAFIVRACNSHDVLVETLRRVVMTATQGRKVSVVTLTQLLERIAGKW